MGRKPKNEITLLGALTTLLEYFEQNAELARELAQELDKVRDYVAKQKEVRNRYTAYTAKSHVQEICRKSMKPDTDYSWWSPIIHNGVSLQSIYLGKSGTLTVFGRQECSGAALTMLLEQLPARIQFLILRRMAGRDGGMSTDEGMALEGQVRRLVSIPKGYD